MLLRVRCRRGGDWRAWSVGGYVERLRARFPPRCATRRSPGNKDLLFNASHPTEDTRMAALRSCQCHFCRLAGCTSTCFLSTRHMPIPVRQVNVRTDSPPALVGSAACCLALLLYQTYGSSQAEARYAEHSGGRLSLRFGPFVTRPALVRNEHSGRRQP
jgi:hypothetical protein